MAHQLDTIRTGALKGKAAFMSVKQPAWHELGQIVDKPQTVEEALFQAGLDFEVARTPVLYTPEVGALAGTPGLSLPEQYVNYRTDTGGGLGVVGSRYTILQNRDALSFFDTIVGERSAVIETAGALYGGRQVFVSALMPEHIHVPGDQDIKNYILLFNSHDGSGSIQALLTPTRVVCRNTLMAALGNSTNRVKLRHTSSAKAKLAQAANLMGVYDQFAKELTTSFEKMVVTKVSEKEVARMIDRLFPSAKEKGGQIASTKALNTRAMIRSYLYGETGGQQSHPGTTYQFYNGITGYFQNVKQYRNPSGKLTSTLMGEDAKVMESAFKMALQLS